MRIKKRSGGKAKGEERRREKEQEITGEKDTPLEVLVGQSIGDRAKGPRSLGGGQRALANLRRAVMVAPTARNPVDAHLLSVEEAGYVEVLLTHLGFVPGVSAGGCHGRSNTCGQPRAGAAARTEPSPSRS